MAINIDKMAGLMTRNGLSGHELHEHRSQSSPDPVKPETILSSKTKTSLSAKFKEQHDIAKHMKMCLGLKTKSACLNRLYERELVNEDDW